jgi:lipopolysaccharide heptosyltransferase II
MQNLTARKAGYHLLKLLAKTLLPSPQKDFTDLQVSKILIYGAMGIGNMIMFTPTLKAIRQHFSNAHITLLVAQSGCEAVIEGTQLVDEIIKVNPDRWERLRLVRHIRKEGYDVLISEFHGHAFKLITLLSGIPYRVGHCQSPGWDSPYDFLYNIQVRMAENEHEIDRDLRLPKALDIQIADDAPLFYVSDDDRIFAKKFFDLHNIDDNDLIVGVQVGTWRRQSWKQWGLTRLSCVCDRLIKEQGAKIVVLGSPKHQEELELFLEAMENQPIVALGKATVKQAAAIVEQCDFTICNDSGLMHISAAMGTPVIAIYGPTDYYRTSPCRYGEQHIVLRKTLPCSPCFQFRGPEKVLSCPNRCCLELITIDDVLKAAKSCIPVKKQKGGIGRSKS